ncbi:hypothetical protein A5721_33455 [Mycobacterium vulneris]|nr:hypothetical protein A5721_33455 [Mycolicibacterium vulneris]
MIKSILSAISGRIDRRSRCNALGFDDESDYPDEFLELSPALAADAGETPGEVSGFPLVPPSPGGSIADHVNVFKQSMAALSEVVGVPVDLAPVYRETANAMREFADQLDGTRPVCEDDLAAHITYVIRNPAPQSISADEVARSLLADFRITYSPSK